MNYELIISFIFTFFAPAVFVNILVDIAKFFIDKKIKSTNKNSSNLVLFLLEYRSGILGILCVIFSFIVCMVIIRHDDSTPFLRLLFSNVGLSYCIYKFGGFNLLKDILTHLLDIFKYKLK